MLGDKAIATPALISRTTPRTFEEVLPLLRATLENFPFRPSLQDSVLPLSLNHFSRVRAPFSNSLLLPSQQSFEVPSAVPLFPQSIILVTTIQNDPHAPFDDFQCYF